jgi:hypothetical protein
MDQYNRCDKHESRTKQQTIQTNKQKRNENENHHGKQKHACKNKNEMTS